MSVGRVNPGFWKDRRVFVTGHTGFMGGWLALGLAGMGARVAGYALDPPTDPNFFTAVGLERDLESTRADVRDAGRLAEAMRAFRPEIVMHLAAQPLVRRAFGEPAETFATNVMGTVNVMEAIRACGSVRAGVIVTSDKVYDNREQGRAFDEEARLGGREPYGSSKACAEMVVRAYRESYFDAQGVGIATARAGNVIGGGDWAADRIVPDAIRAFAAGRPLVLRHPEATRPWQHVLEPVHGYLLLAERLAEDAARWSGGWNFGPDGGGARPVSWLADQVTLHWGNGAKWHAAPVDGPYEAGRLSIDVSKAAELGWRPVWPAEEAAARTVEWYRAHHRGADVRALSLAQIEAYRQ